MICGNVLVGVLSNEQIRVPSINIDIGDRQHSKLTALHNDRAVAVYNLSDRTISGNYSHSVLSLPQVTFFPDWADNDLFINWTGHSAIIKLTKRKVPNTTTCTEPRHNQGHVWHHTRNSDLKCWCKRYTLQLLWQKCKLHHREIELGWTLTPICRKIWQEHFPLLLQILKKGRVHPQSESLTYLMLFGKKMKRKRKGRFDWTRSDWRSYGWSERSSGNCLRWSRRDGSNRWRLGWILSHRAHIRTCTQNAASLFARFADSGLIRIT